MYTNIYFVRRREFGGEPVAHATIDSELRAAFGATHASTEAGETFRNWLPIWLEYLQKTPLPKVRLYKVAPLIRKQAQVFEDRGGSQNKLNAVALRLCAEVFDYLAQHYTAQQHVVSALDSPPAHFG